MEEIEMREMFDIADSGSETDTSNLSKAMRDERSSVEPVNTEQAGDLLGYNLLLPHLPPAAAANGQHRRDQWTQQGQSLKRWHFVPRLVTFTPANTDCPVDPDSLEDRRRTYAINARHGLAIDRTD
eukprot:849419-Pyramimonas_sp.AAC.1